MANLRDQLLKAGLIDKATKQQADTADRRKRKKKKKKKKGTETDKEAERLKAYDARIATQAEENRAREAARQAQHEDHERRNQLRNLVRSGAERALKPGNRRFCFVSRKRRIQWLYVSEETSEKLERGALAIVEQPVDEEEPFVLVPRATAERISALDREAIRFWNDER